MVKKADITSVLNDLFDHLKNVRAIQEGVSKIEQSLIDNPNEKPQDLINEIKPKIKEILDSIPYINNKMKQAASEEMSEESADSLHLLKEQLTGFNGLLRKIQTFPQAIQTELLGNVQDINRNFQNMQQNMGTFKQPKKHPLVATYDFLYDLLGQWWMDLPKLGKNNY